MKQLFCLLTPFLLFILSLLPAQAQDNALYPGVYNNQNPLILYSGSWSLANNTAVGMKSSTSSTAQYSAFEFMFVGTGVEILTRTGAGLGTIDICVDLNCTSHNLDGANTAVAISRTGFTQGVHSYRARYNGTTNGFFLYYLTVLGESFPVSHSVSVTNFPSVQAVSVTNIPSVSITNIPSVRVTNVPSVSVTNMPTLQAVEVQNSPDSSDVVGLKPGFYDDRNSAINFYGNWDEESGGYRLHDTTSYTDEDFSITVTAFANRVTFYVDAYAYSQEITVCVDAALPGAICEEITLTSGTPGTIRNYPLTIQAADYGIHTFSIDKETGDSQIFRIDGILVHELGLSTWTVGDDEQAVQFNYSMTAGDVFSGVMGAGTFFLVLLGLLFWYWRTKDA